MASNAAGTSNAGSGADGDAPRRNRPKYSKFTQQELPACPAMQVHNVGNGDGKMRKKVGEMTASLGRRPDSSPAATPLEVDYRLDEILLRLHPMLLLADFLPILTPKWVISVFCLVGIIFVPVGVVSLLAARDVVEIIDRYDHACVPENMTDNKLGYIRNETISKDCTRTLTVTKDMKQPIFVYYQLDNFYQNHRRYVKSRNDAQLRDYKKANQTTFCEPERFTADGKPIVPCGLIAWSLFNDTYSFIRGNENLTVDKKDISWKSDREHKFAKNVYPSIFQNGALIGGKMLDASIPLSEQEDLIVWMRTAALPTFRKLYGRIYVDLKVNDTIIVRLSNNYNTYNFGGKKKLVLSTATWLGGKNEFLGFAYLVVGGLCIFLAFAFTLLYVIKPRKLGDHNFLSWNRCRR